MSAAQVTEAHIALARDIMLDHTPGRCAETLGVRNGAQLIADSEAKACDQLRADVEQWELAFQEQFAQAESAEREVERLRECCDQTSKLCGKFIIEDDGTDLIPNSARIANALARMEARAERAEAEVERLKKQIKDDNLSYGCELRDPYGTIWEQATKDHDRAGKAERALAELREWQAGVIANERLHHAERKDAIARAESAEREVERLKPYVSKAVLTHEGTMLCSPMVAVKFNEETARAERAEAELNASRYETVKAAQEGLREYIRAERAEAFLRTLGKWEEAQ